MFFQYAKRWWQSRSVRRPNRRPRVTRLSLEHLEDRLVPSTFEPWQIQQAYGFNQISFNNGAVPGDGTGQTIAIVDAYNDPNIAQDVNTFDQEFGLTSANSPTLYQKYGDASSFLSVVNQTGGSTLPVDNSSWSGEISLDVEWAHAIAPGAKIVLVEANSNSGTDLYSAAKYAGSIPGVSVVSMSFGGSFSGEAYSDPDFSHAGVTYVASAGDNGLFTYPGASANVLAVGGTSLTLDASGNYVSEKVWNDSADGGSEPAWITSGGGTVLTNPPPSSWGESGGGPSPYDTHKIGPDVGYNADPDTGYYVYDSYGEPGWIGEGGTSEGAPQWAALIAIADQGRAADGLASLSGSQTLKMIHNANMETFDFHHGFSGSIEYTLNGTQHTYSGRSVYGQGTPIANVLVGDLVYGKVPPVPIGLTATAVSSSEIDLSWNSSTDAHSYKLQWSTNGTTWNLLTTTSGTSYADTGLAIGTKYYYRILASNGLGSSAYSKAVNATTKAASPPLVTTNPTSHSVSAGNTITFTASATGSPTPTVQWEVSTDGGSTWTAISGATSTTLTLSNVTTAMNRYQYEAVFTNNLGSATTSGAWLTVAPASTIVYNAASVNDLINDLTAANSDPSQQFLINLTNSLYDLTAVNNISIGSNGLPVITGNVIIEGNNATIERDTSASAFRLFQVQTGGSLSLYDLWLKNGLAYGQDGWSSSGTPNVAIGGAIYSTGTLNLNDVVMELNKAEGSNSANGTLNGSGHYGADAYGGGLYVAGGSVTLTDDCLYANSAQGGNGGAPAGNGLGGEGGSAWGGGIFVGAGSVTLNHDSIIGNSAKGGTGGSNAGLGGYAIGGGFVLDGGTLNLNNDYIDANVAQGGNGGIAGNLSGGGYGGFSQGGGLSIKAGTATLTNDFLGGNEARGGNGGSATTGVDSYGGGGGDAYGGGFDVSGTAILNDVTLSHSDAIGGQGASGSRGGNGGSGGSAYGGGLLVSGGSLTLTNATLVAQGSFGGNGRNGGNNTGIGLGGNGGNGGSALGGSLLVQAGSLTLTNDTINDPIVESGYAGNGGSGTTQGNGGNGGNATGGGIALTGGTTALTNTIVANGSFWAAPGGSGATSGSSGTASDPDISGNFTSSDHDLIGDGTGGNVVNGVNGNQVGTSTNPIDPLLGPLQNNGGPYAGSPDLFGSPGLFGGQQVVPTLALLASSPAINAGDNSASPGSTDERGYLRIVGGIIDIGAFEYQANVSADVSVALGSLVYNSSLQEYVQTVTITNTSGSALLGPLALELTNLSSNATLANPSGSDNGNPYLDFVSPGGQLAAGQSLTVTLYFKDPTNQSISYGTQVWQNL